MKRLFPVIHLLNESQAVRNAEMAVKAGCAGVFLIHHKLSYRTLITLAEKVHENLPNLWIGINALDKTPKQILSGNLPQWISGVWVDNCGICETPDYQIIEAIEAERFWLDRIMDNFHKFEYFGGYAFKYQKPISPFNLKYGAQRAARVCDVVVTTGQGTGVAAKLDKIKLIYSGVNQEGGRLGIASGITPENVTEYFPYVEDYLVSTGISVDDYNFNESKLNKLQQLITA